MEKLYCRVCMNLLDVVLIAESSIKPKCILSCKTCGTEIFRNLFPPLSNDSSVMTEKEYNKSIMRKKKIDGII